METKLYVAAIRSIIQIIDKNVRNIW